MEPLRECVSMRTFELRWGRLLTRGSYDLVITGSSLCGCMLHRYLEFSSCVLDVVSVVLIFNKLDVQLDGAKSASENHKLEKLPLC